MTAQEASIIGRPRRVQRAASMGVVAHRKVGDEVRAGEPLFALHAASEESLAMARERLLAAHTWAEGPVEPPPLFYDVLV